VESTVSVETVQAFGEALKFTIASFFPLYDDTIHTFADSLVSLILKVVKRYRMHVFFCFCLCCKMLVNRFERIMDW